MSDNFVPSVRVGIRTATTVLHLAEPMSIEVGKHRKVIFVDRVTIRYGNEPETGFWRWKSVILKGFNGSGDPAVNIWNYGDHEVPIWLVVLIYAHIPQYRTVRSQK